MGDSDDSTATSDDEDAESESAEIQTKVVTADYPVKIAGIFSVVKRNRPIVILRKKKNPIKSGKLLNRSIRFMLPISW